MKKLTLICLSVLFYACSGDSDPEPQPDPCETLPQIVGVVVAPTSTCAATDGRITINATSERTLNFSIDGTNFQSQNEFNNLAAGDYEITVKDELGCTVLTSAIIEAPNSTVSIANIIADESGCKTTNGSLTISADGEGDLQYFLNNGNPQSGNVFNSLPSGSYQVGVLDANGCQITQNVILTSGVSFSDQVNPIFVANCNLSNCHNGSNNSIPDFNNFDNIKSRASDIKARTQSGNMPVNGSLTQEEKDLIACWVDDGALNN